MTPQRPAAGPHEVAFEAFGVRVAVRVESEEELIRVRALLPPGWRPCAPSAVAKRFGLSTDRSGAHAVHRGDRIVVKQLELDLALQVLEGQVRGYVALHAPDRIFVHAGAVACGYRTIVMPGMSFAGKTTLVAALVRAGATYYSDEYAVLDDRGLVHPYPRPLTIRDGAGNGTAHAVETLGGRAGEVPLRIGVVLVTKYRPDAEWNPQRRSRGEGALALLANTVPAKTRPAQAMRVLTRAAAGATVIESDRAEADSVVGPLLSELES